MATCPRCRGPISEATAVCPHCQTYLLEWDARRGRLGPAPEGDGPRPRPSLATSRSPLARARVAELARGARPLSTHLSLSALRWLCGAGMAVHGLLVLTRLVEPSLTLVAWIVLWLPLDSFWRSTR